MFVKENSDRNRKKPLIKGKETKNKKHHGLPRGVLQKVLLKILLNSQNVDTTVLESLCNNVPALAVNFIKKRHQDKYLPANFTKF